MDTWIERADRTIYRAERIVVVTALLIMSFLVFVDVVHRRYTDPESKTAALVAKLLGYGEGSSQWQFLQDNAAYGIAAFAVAMIFLGLRTTSTRTGAASGAARGARISRGRALMVAVAVTAASWTVMALLFGSGEVVDFAACESPGYRLDCGVFPNGLVWSQPVALILMAWVGFLGASMATRDNRHLRVEAVEKRLPARLRPWVGLARGLLTAAFACLLAYWGFAFVGVKYDEYLAADGLGGFHDGIDFPRYQGFLIIPTAYAIMAARFVIKGIRAYRGIPDEAPSEFAGLDLKLDEVDEAGEAGDAAAAEKGAASS